MKNVSGQFCDAVQPQILGIHPYIPGKPVEEVQRELGLTRVSKLASNENPLGASPRVVAAVQSELTEIARYPDGSAYRLKQELSEFLSVGSEQIAVGNGSNELLELAARVFAGPGDEVVYSQYGFAVYPISAQVVGATAVEVPAKNWGHDLDAMLEAITDKTKIVYIANPNNPTGTVFGKTEWERFISRVPEKVVVVLDEAYLEFCEFDGYPNGMDYIADYPNLLVSRTFSKAYGLASLRIGYMVGCKEVVQYINQLREPFNVNHYAQVAAMAAIKDQDFVRQSVKVNREGMQQICDALAELGIEWIPSSGNFVCAHFGEHAGEVNQALLHQGVIVRPLGNYKMPETLRISIGTREENRHFIEALKFVLKELSAA
ncbi:histidinol-phosphate transaminase [Thiomicrorhabdus sp. ZW0627]|uniref:histidinol-phosphate transaminase n=1 Tax=Thiomicrorhabdus sp. ZW0627 TaxID=3039774 RepID=UPI002436D05E|nr:histidinol-phosphate transaminase [Thiomicrorhabdus sp. ZW0627]MDG6772903.1 histidinol-phosphate transaminase [Thiomicrorhabdus sp. ZW0627]